MKPRMDMRQLSIPMNENLSGKIKTLESKTNFLKKVSVQWAASKAAGDALANIELARIKGEEEVACTGIRLAVATLKTAMVANAMPQIGSLTTRLNANTAATDQSITNGCSGEIVTHMHNRSENMRLFIELKLAGKINTEEETALQSFADQDAIQDIERTKRRAQEARDAVDALHSCALHGISKQSRGFE